MYDPHLSPGSMVVGAVMARAFTARFPNAPTTAIDALLTAAETTESYIAFAEHGAKLDVPVIVSATLATDIGQIVTQRFGDLGPNPDADEESPEQISAAELAELMERHRQR